MPRTPLPDRRRCETREIAYGNDRFEVCIGYDDCRQPKEVFCNGPKVGSDLQAQISDACILTSIALQYGATPDELVKTLGRVPAWHGGNEVEVPASVIGAIVEEIGRTP